MAKVRTTDKFRLHVDVDSRNPADARELQAFAGVVEDVIRDLRSVRRVTVSQIIPAEGDNFHWPEPDNA